MLKDVPKKKLPMGILICAFGILLASNLFSWNLSTIALLIGAGIVNLAVSYGKGGEVK